MGNRKDMKNVLGNFISKPKNDHSGTEVPSAIDTINPPELEKEKPVKPIRKVGRPKKNEDVNGNETKATFVIDKVLLQKLRFISVMRNKMQKDILQEALEAYLKKWEKDNGEIPIK